MKQVGEQAATIARLEVQLQASKESLGAVTQERDQAKAQLVTATESLLKAEKTLREAKDMAAVANRESAAMSNALASTKKDLASAERQLAAIAAEQAEKQKSQAILGRWEEKSGPSNKKEFSFLADGTGVYDPGDVGQWPKFEIAEQVWHAPTNEPGVYKLRGTKYALVRSGLYDTVQKNPDGEVVGVFRVNTDGSEATLEGWGNTYSIRFHKLGDEARK